MAEFHLWEVGILVLCGSVALGLLSFAVGFVIVNVDDWLWEKRMAREREVNHKIVQAFRSAMFRGETLTETNMREIVERASS